MSDGGESKSAAATGGRKWQGNKSSSTKSTFRAPTKGLEAMVFDAGENMSAAEFIKINSALAEHIGVAFEKGGPTLAQALKDLKEPAFKDPDEPADATNPIQVKK